jgi:TonB family protein
MRTAHKISFITGLTLSFLSAFTRADFELGMSYYEAKNFDKAYKEFLEAAQYGDYDAQNNIGAMHYRGEHVAKNVITAYAWMALAAQTAEYDATAVHNKIFARMSDADKKLAEAEYKNLFSQYSDAAIEQKLTPAFTGKTLSVKDQRAIKRVAPDYPQAMLQQNASGFVDVIFTIDKYGITRDHAPTYAVSKSFERTAVRALRQFQFEPMKINNQPVAANGFRIRFNFEMKGASYNKKKLDKVIAEQRQKAATGSEQDKLGFAYFLEAVPSFASDYKLSDNPNQWYVEAANQGSGVASYFLGRNVLYGNMCTQDNSQSMGWLLKAAKAGVTDAQYMLAIESFSGARFEKNEDKGFYWLARAANANKAAKVRYAWILATHPDTKRRDGKLASEYLNGVEKNYLDKQSYYQTQAAVAAENNDFKQAIKWQKEALEDAQDLKLPVQILEQQLASYSAQKPWREEI